MHSSEGVKLFPVYIPVTGTLGRFHTQILCTISSNPLQMFLSRFTYLYRPFCHSLFMSSFDCFGSARPRGLTFTWWGCAVYAFDKPTELAHSFSFCSWVSISVFMAFLTVFVRCAFLQYTQQHTANVLFHTLHLLSGTTFLKLSKTQNSALSLKSALKTDLFQLYN